MLSWSNASLSAGIISSHLEMRMFGSLSLPSPQAAVGFIVMCDPTSRCGKFVAACWPELVQMTRVRNFARYSRV